MYIVLIIIIFNLITVLARSTSPIVEIDPEGEKAVRLDDPLTILCRVGVPLEHCRVEIPSEGSIILKQDQPPEDGISYYGGGADAGQCGVTIAKVQEKHDGLFRCNLLTKGGRSEISATTTIIVASKSLPFTPLYSPAAQLGFSLSLFFLN